LRAGGSQTCIDMNLRRGAPWSIVALVVAVHSVFFVLFFRPLIAIDRGAGVEYSMVLRMVQRTPIPMLVGVPQDAGTDPRLQRMEESPNLLPTSVAKEAPVRESFLLGAQHFFPRDLVDQPAHPALDWHVRAETIPADVLSTIVFTAWVDENGSMTQWKIEEQTPPGDWASSLMAKLAETPMQSAILNGQPVASVATFEIGFDTRLFR
jgi:hypothetical protein